MFFNKILELKPAVLAFIQHGAAGYTDYPALLRLSEVHCVAGSLCISRVFLSRCHLSVRGSQSCLPGFQSALSSSEDQSVLCRPGEMRWDTRVPRCGVRKTGWSPSRHDLQSGNQMRSILFMTLWSLDHLCPLVCGRCASSGCNHHLRVTGYAVHSALIAAPISAITTAVSGVDQ